MTEYIAVTRTQRDAARWMAERAKAQGQPVPSSTRLIAEAEPSSRPTRGARSATSGTTSAIESTTRVGR